MRLVLEHAGEYSSQWAAISSIAGKIGCTAETLRRWVRQAERDEGLKPGPTSAEQVRIRDLEREVRRVFEENFSVYGARKVWRQLRREGFEVARCTVERLMRAMGLHGTVRGKKVRTIIADRSAPCPLDLVKRRFQAPRPNALWVSDFTCVATAATS